MLSTNLTMNLADIVDLSEAVEKVFYCDSCDLMKDKYTPRNYPEELKCECTGEVNTNDEYLYW